MGFSGNTLYESIPVLWGSVDGSWGQAHPARHLHKVFPTALTALPKPGRVLPRHIPITASLVCCCSLRSQLLVLRSPCATQVTLGHFADSHCCARRGNSPANCFFLLWAAGEASQAPPRQRCHARTQLSCGAGRGELQPAPKNSC